VELHLAAEPAALGPGISNETGTLAAHSRFMQATCAAFPVTRIYSNGYAKQKTTLHSIVFIENIQ
jgi:hypothetical protein